MSSDTVRCILRPENVLFMAQICSVFIVICVSLANLTMKHDNHNLWQMILTSSLAAIMPTPKFKTAFPEPEPKEEVKVKTTATQTAVETQA